jgi:hypothetical protein
MARRKELPLDKMPSGHLKVGDIVRLGWPAGMGNGLFLVLEVYDPNTIQDVKVVSVREGLGGQAWYARSTGATVVGR